MKIDRSGGLQDVLRRDKAMQYLKAICGFGCFVILASNVWSMSHWNEARGVNDDFCYLRQAHLFQKYGLGGLDTKVSGDDDNYLSAKMMEMNLVGWDNLVTPPCHIPMPPTNKMVIQYPPGTGFLMAAFPEGHQVIPLFVLATVAIFGLALLAIVTATTTLSLLLTTAFADVAIYMMINPTKASYSMAPTMVVCALAGFLTAYLFAKAPQRRRIAVTMLTGFVLGLAVDFRIANLLLSAGYCLFLLFAFLRSPKLATFLQGALFGLALLAGMAPTLIYNAINAGSPFKTTYGGVDVAAPNLDLAVLWSYATDIQFVLLVIAIAWIVFIFCSRSGSGLRQVALVTTVNLVVNLAYFMSHPVFTQYYTIPISAISLWSLLFASLMQPAEAGDDDLVGQAATA